MRKYDPKKPLIFIHVPKSAGTAVRNVFANWFPERFFCNYYNEAEGKMPELLPSELLHDPLKPPLIYGHFNKFRGFGIEDYYPTVSQFVTILRHPFETALSHYFYTRKRGGDWKDQSRIPTEGIEEHLKTAKPKILNHFPRAMNLTNYRDILEELFIEIGITEMLPTSLDRIACKLGKQFDSTTLSVLNVTERDQPIPERYRDNFAEAYPLELAVYDFARSRLATP